MKTQLLHFLKITTIIFTLYSLHCKAENFTVKFWHNGEVIHTTTVEENNTITNFPDSTNLLSNNTELPIFVGWTTNPTGYNNITSNLEPTYFHHSTPITSNTDLYAIFGNGPKEDSWFIVRQTSELTDGSQIIIANKKYNVAVGPQHTDKYRIPKAITLSNDTTQITNIGEAVIFTLGTTSQGYSFYSESEEHYMVLTSDANATHTNKTISTNYPSMCYWGISITNNRATIQNTYFTSRLLQYNSTYDRFSCYENTESHVSIYKKHNKATQWTICTKYQITLNYNNGTINNFLSSTLNIPTEHNPSFNDENIEFVGWSTSPITPTTTQPTLYNNSTTQILTKDINLYPVFATHHTEIKPFDLHATHPQQVIIAAYINGSWRALKNNLPTTDVQNTVGVNVTPSPYNYIYTQEASNYIWTITKESEGYTISNGTKYLYNNSSKIGTQNNISYWNITPEVNNTYLISNTTDNCLLFRNSSTPPKVGHYSTSNKNHNNYNRPSLLAVATPQTIYSTIPQKYIDTENFTLSESMDIDIIIEPNLTLNITNNCSINNLTIKTNSDDYSAINTTNGTLTTQQITIEKCFNSSRWFFFSLPFDCDLTNISATDANGNHLIYAPNPTSGDYVINHYDQNRSTETGKAWKELLGTNHTLNANQGYIIGYFGEGQITVKFPSKTPQTIAEPTSLTLNYTNSWINTTNPSTSTNGWNLIGYPYFFPTNSTLTPPFATIPNPDGMTYTQTEYKSATINPFTSFFVQTTSAPTFNINNQQSAPVLSEPINDKITILLSDTNSRSDHTTIINNPHTTTEYEIGHDLIKWIGYAQIPQIYSIQNNELLAFNSQPINNSTTIPLGIYIPNTNEYTFSINNQILPTFNVNLYDKATQTTTNLNNNTYTLHLDSGTYNNRFELLFSQEITNNSYIEKQNISIHQNNAMLQIENLPNDAIIYIYDAIGHLIFQSPNNITSLNYNFTYNGIYIITIQTTNSIFTFKTSH